MTIDGAIVTEQGITFAIVIVRPSVLQSSLEAGKLRAALQAGISDFRAIPLILACQDAAGVFEYQGRRDIVGFLASVHPSRIPWRRYTVS